METLQGTSAIELTEYWNQKTSDKRKISDWKDLVNEYSKTISTAGHLNLKNMLTRLSAIQ